MKKRKTQYERALKVLYNTGMLLIKQGRSQLDLFVGDNKSDLSSLSEGRRFLQVAMSFDNNNHDNTYEEFYDTST